MNRLVFLERVSENNFQKSCKFPLYFVYFHLISSGKCHVWHKSLVIGADMRNERDIQHS